MILSEIGAGDGRKAAQDPIHIRGGRGDRRRAEREIDRAAGSVSRRAAQVERCPSSGVDVYGDRDHAGIDRRASE